MFQSRDENGDYLAEEGRFFFSFEGLTCLAKCFMKIKKFSVVIQPEGCVTLTQPVGPSRMKWSLKFAMGRYTQGAPSCQWQIPLRT